MNKTFLLSFLILLISCGPKKIDYCSRDEYIRQMLKWDGKNQSVFYDEKGKLDSFKTLNSDIPSITTFEYFDNGTKTKVEAIKTKIIGNNNQIFGNYFLFDETGCLKRFCFFVGTDNLCRSISEYSTSKRKMELGTPLVCFYSDNKNTRIKLFFSSALFNSLDIQYYYSASEKPKQLRLKQSNLQPFLYEGDIERPKSDLYIRTEAHRADKALSFVDTIRIDNDMSR